MYPELMAGLKTQVDGLGVGALLWAGPVLFFALTRRSVSRECCGAFVARARCLFIDRSEVSHGTKTP